MKKSLLTRLSIKDLWFDRKISFCIIAALMAVIAPLMLLFSLKYGTVAKLQKDLLSNPANLEINIEGIGLKLSPAWLDWVKQQPETGFAIFRTAKLDSEVRLIKQGADVANALNDVGILATQPSDPVTTGYATLTRPDGIIISHNANKKLGLKVGEVVELTVYRKFNQTNEAATLPFVVEGILPPTQYSREAAFVSLDFLLAMDNYKNGYSANLQFQDTSTDPNRTFPNVRLYAKDLDSVAVLAKKIKDKFHISSMTRDADIKTVKDLDHVLSTVFSVIAIVSLVGCILSLWGSFWANIDRKRKDIALLRLLGFQSKDIILYLISQAITLSGIAYFCALFFYTAGSIFYNYTFVANNKSDNFVSTMPWSYLFLAFLATLIIASIVALWGGLRAVRIQPAESLREV